MRRMRKMKKRELLEENKALRAMLKDIENQNKAYGNNLKPCRSGQCLGCKFSVTITGRVWGTGKPMLVGCSKDLLCDEYQPYVNNTKQEVN